MTIQIDNSRDANLTDFSKAILEDRYLLKEIKDEEGNIIQEDETFQELFKRVAEAYKDDDAHGQRIYDYMSKCWFMPATPVLANGGLKDSHSLPISCYLNEVLDKLVNVINAREEGATVGTITNIFSNNVENNNLLHDIDEIVLSSEQIAKLRTENGYLATSGGGIGTYWGNVREMGSKIGKRGDALGIVPQMKVQDSMILADTQSGIRRGSSAAYLPISHPETEEFIDIRRPTGGDPNRRCLNLHHGVVLTDDFMKAVENGSTYWFRSPKDNKAIAEVSARDLWIKILSARVETGEPYILYEGNMQKNKSPVYQAMEEKYGMKPKTSNLCSEITLFTGLDQLQKERTAVCCLSSLNLEYFEEWKDNELFIEDIMRFLDNVLTDFINRAPDTMEKAKYSAMRERSVGLGVMGFHSFLQSKNTPFEGVAAKSWNKIIFKHIKEKCDLANEKLANDWERQREACPDAKDLGLNLRFSNCTAIAPTASISIICGNSSPGIEPFIANCYTHKTLSGTFIVRNKHLAKLLESKGKNTSEVWSSISMNEGSIMHLDFLTPEEKDVFKTAMELNQMWLIDHAADRQPFIDQAQSLNIFVPSNVAKAELHKIHFQAWKKGIKSLYYCRSASIQRAEKTNEPKTEELPSTQKEVGIGGLNANDECLACQ
jgi:ribonucleoside-diphosphate reductase alpha chain